ncbi:ABC transporter substrate-binding protein [Paenibacillus humicola]|uniref:ABC transporter substrate-binding protein n=1 Tax=Paenibacillus humicola TaxID=3110540 RepID=UPI00237A4D2F|nr:ABC transporter substrate-binding protein [Paenibacillus humicola]
MKGFTKTRKAGLVFVVMTLLVAVLAACSGGGQDAANSPPAGSGGENGGGNTAAGKTVNGVDLSKHVNLKMYLLGDKPADGDAVLAELNKLIGRDLNATLSIEYLPWSDWQQKYPLILASGENVDLIYTSDWALYQQEAAKGAFVEVTDDILKKYMPLTAEKQNKISLDQGRLNGKLYFVPRSDATYTGESAVLIRGDLREKYGLPPLKSTDDLENYYKSVAANEKSIFPLANSLDNSAKSITFSQPRNNVTVYTTMIGVGEFSYLYDKNKPFSVDQVSYNFFQPDYPAWAKKMKQWADAGYWSKNALVNKTETRDAFENGTSASMVWNIGTVGASADKVLKEHPEWKPEIYDVTPNSIKQLGLYTNDGMAVAYTSQNVERSFMLLDKLKFDKDYNQLFIYGVKGKHWIPEGDDKYKPGPDYDKYKGGQNGTWGVNNQEDSLTLVGENKAVAQLQKEWEPKTVHPITEGFKFDPTKVKSELATFTSLEAKYGPLLDLGLAGDVDKTLAEFKDQAMKAGFEKIDKELKTQLEAYIKTKQQ